MNSSWDRMLIMVCMDKLEIASIKIVKKMIEKEKRRKGRKVGNNVRPS
jgi:hypothetical protein